MKATVRRSTQLSQPAKLPLEEYDVKILRLVLEKVSVRQATFVHAIATSAQESEHQEIL